MGYVKCDDLLANGLWGFMDPSASHPKEWTRTLSASTTAAVDTNALYHPSQKDVRR